MQIPTQSPKADLHLWVGRRLKQRKGSSMRRGLKSSRKHQPNIQIDQMLRHGSPSFDILETAQASPQSSVVFRLHSSRLDEFC